MTQDDSPAAVDTPADVFFGRGHLRRGNGPLDRFLILLT